ncbi:MAG: hypothetical protein WC076_08795 [Terrimicrobiaceae bacterium]|nr:hypothetical protein [Terrimicrobiaceae bacterium]
MDELAWDDACLRLEDYLRAHGVRPRERLLALTLEMIRQARGMHAKNPGKSPLETTMKLVIDRTDAWFSTLAGAPERTVRARVAFFSPSFQRKWASEFWVSSPPEELLAEIRNATIEAGPALDFQSLVRKEMDYGAMKDLARETWGQFSWSHALRAFLLWLVVVLVAYGAYLRFFA